MKKISFLFIFSIAAITGFTQFRFDNVLYKTIDPKDLCKELQSGKGYLILDVRSRGEYADTSSAPVYNLGHLDNAVNIDVSEVGKRFPEIASYKNKPVYVYCSHSQRSRRASKMLADSGFTNIINVNGGLTAIRRLPSKNCLNNLVVSNVGYKIIPATVLCEKLSAASDKLFLLDVRSDSAFRHIDLRANVNAFGTFKNSINIPLEDLKKRMAEVPMDKEIIITDIFGSDAARAAALLRDNGYKNISMLMEGVDHIHFTDSRELSCLGSQYISPVKYKLISTADFKRLAENNPDYFPLDVRAVDEFANKHKDNWRNIGHLMNAVNIPSTELAAKIKEIEKYKNKPVVVYTFSGSKEAHEAANILIGQGFSNVYVLAGGLFNIRWSAGNVNGFASLNKLVLDVPADNL